MVQADTRHRHQTLDRHLYGDLAGTHLFLHAVGKKFNQRQAAGHPTQTAIEHTGQFFQPIAKALFELGQQPAFFQCTLSLRPTQRTIQHQGLGFVQRPDHRLDRIATELLESRDALMTINDQKTLGLIGHSDDNDRIFLSPRGERGQ